MKEYIIGTIPLAGWMLQGIGCWLYMLGGRSNKWIRRWIGALLCTSSVVVEALIVGIFSFWMLIDYPLTVISFHLGYGSQNLKTKILKRSVVVAASMLSGLLLCILIGGKAWLILPIHFIVAMMTVYLGVINPIQAADEEFFVCAFLRICNLMYIFASNSITITGG